MILIFIIFIDHLEPPNPALESAWSAIKVPAGFRERLLAQALLALQLRQQFPFETMPIHGLVLLSGQPDTSKTTLARLRSLNINPLIEDN